MAAFSAHFTAHINQHTDPFIDGLVIKKPAGCESHVYGNLCIDAAKASITKSPCFFRFTTDCSGSMSDRCKDGRTKMEHIRHTMTNMMHFFADNEEEASIYVQVSAFDDQIHHIIATTLVTKDNVLALITAIDTMRPMQNTNIELALTDAASAVDAHLALYPDHVVSHIFMTDGDATAGICNPSVLASLVTDNCSNTFIAFGLQHNPSMMLALGRANKRSSNWLIDKLENAGLVYGEILNNELYKVMTNVSVVVTDGLIYDYLTGEFVDKLYLGDLVTEVKKVYHILAPDSDVVASVSGTTMNGSTYHRYASVVQNSGIDLTEQALRLRCQQYMFEAKNFEYVPSQFRAGGLRRQFALGPFPQIDEPVIEPTFKTPVEVYRKEMTDFMDFMKKYMKDTGKEEDPFMLGLCDDMYITIRSLGTHRQAMCIVARETSQGRQQTYNVNDFDLDSAQFGGAGVRHQLMRSQTTAYQTPSALRMMRTCTGSQVVEEEVSAFP